MTKTRIVSRKFSELVFDFNLYPRSQIDSVHVTDLARLALAGTEFAPIVIWERDNRVVDGFHRSHCYERLYGPDHPIDCVAKSYPDDAAMFRDAVRFADNVLKKFTAFDRVHCLVVAERLGIQTEQIAADLRMTLEAVGELRADRVGKLRVGKKNEPVPLKRTIRHMAGQTLTEDQAHANDRLSGMNQLFYVNQIVDVLENGLLEPDNEKLVERLKHLGKLIRELT
jgi:hypothetical protein